MLRKDCDADEVATIIGEEAGNGSGAAAPGAEAARRAARRGRPKVCNGMTFSRDMDFEGRLVPLDMLDMETADRLLAGTVAPEDAPPGYADVTRLLQAAWAEPTSDEIPSEDVIVARIAGVVRSSSSTASFSPHKPRKPFGLTRSPIATALVAAALVCSAGLASAGALPDAIQGAASATLAKVGISVPD
jgi:hypothetical protein